MQRVFLFFSGTCRGFFGPKHRSKVMFDWSGPEACWAKGRWSLIYCNVLFCSVNVENVTFYATVLLRVIMGQIRIYNTCDV